MEPERLKLSFGSARARISVDKTSRWFDITDMGTRYTPTPMGMLD